MTYEEALDLKTNKLPFRKDRLNFVWFVVPQKGEDLNKYITDYFTTDNIKSDEDSKKYSTDGDFSLWYFVKK